LNIPGGEFTKVYARQLKIIEKKLESLLIGRKPRSLYEPCGYILQGGGKRIRPFLVLAAAKASGGEFRDVYNAALSVEVLHNFTLVHDDIMDNSNKRRGRLTLHKKYNINTAILAGDNLNAIAYELLLKDCTGNSKNIIETFTHGIIEICEGQSLDKEFEIRKNVTIEEYKVMIFKKTAALAQMCCSIGAQIAVADKKTVSILESYGKNIGMAFQIQDDLLDILADEKEFGKKIGGDLIEGKKTYLFLKALEKAKGADKKKLELIIKNKGVQVDQVEVYKNLYKKLDVLNDAGKEIEKYTKLALRNLHRLPDNNGAELLNSLAYALIGRNK
jgi:geranylgeranyl diphosphate synthase, type II